MMSMEKTFRQLVVHLIKRIDDLEDVVDARDRLLGTMVPRTSYDEAVKHGDAVQKANETLTHASEDWHKRYREADAANDILRERVVDLQARIDRSKRNPNRNRR